MSCTCHRDEQKCSQQKPWTPKQRSRKCVKLSCAAVCEATGRRCKNCAQIAFPSASLVLKLSGCCTICNMHAAVAKKKLLAFKATALPYAAEQALGVTMSYDEWLAGVGYSDDVTTASLLGAHAPDTTAFSDNAVHAVNALYNRRIKRQNR
jgi:hypothetical protein